MPVSHWPWAGDNTGGGEVGAKENWMKNLEVENFDSLGKALVRQIS